MPNCAEVPVGGGGFLRGSRRSARVEPRRAPRRAPPPHGGPGPGGAAGEGRAAGAAPRGAGDEAGVRASGRNARRCRGRSQTLLNFDEKIQIVLICFELFQHLVKVWLMCWLYWYRTLQATIFYSILLVRYLHNLMNFQNYILATFDKNNTIRLILAQFCRIYYFKLARISHNYEYNYE